jgi:AcrR family transcriptional regulator
LTTKTVKVSSQKDGNVRRRGAHRDAAAHQAILSAALSLLEEEGYGATTIERIAARAGVGKATIYRWWTSKAALFGEAVASTLNPGPEPNTGDSYKDLVATIRVTMTNYSHPDTAAVLPALIGHVDRDGDVLESFRSSFLADRREHARELLERAIDRGDLPPDADVWLLMDVWAGVVFYRSVICGTPLEPELAGKLADLVLTGKIPRVSSPDSMVGAREEPAGETAH